MNKFFKTSLGLIRSYKWNSLFFKYFKMLLIVIIIPAIVFMAIILNYYLSSIKTDITTAQRYDIIKSVTQLDKAYDLMDSAAEHLRASSVSARAAAGESGEAIEEEYRALLNGEKSAIPFVNSISVYIPASRYVFSSYSSAAVSDFRDTSWLSAYLGANAEFSVGAQKPGMYNLCRGLTVDNRNRGLIIFTVDGQQLFDRVYSGEVGEAENVMLFDGEDRLIYSSDAGESYAAAGQSIEKILCDADYKQDATLSAGGYLYNFIASENYDVKLASALSMAAYKKNYSHIALIMLTYFAITFVMVILFSLAAAFSFYRSIVNVVVKTSSVGDEMGFYAKEKNDELMYLSDTLLNTVKNHQQIESELVDKLTKLKKVQSIALQTQINPHFLFNSLNLVNGFILEECRGDSRAATMLSNISDILYIALNTKEHIVSVETELEYARKYLEIEKIKYPDRFVVKYDISPETRDLKTVKFVLQPIIENAIEHGIKHMGDKPGLIKVSSVIMNNKLVMSVSDNGPKIPKKTLEQLERWLEEDEIRESKHIGLSNVNQRIKLIFGEEYGVSVFSDSFETVVDIVMPVMEYEA